MPIDGSVVNAVETAMNKDADSLIRLSSGVILESKSNITPMLFLDIMDIMDKEKPKVPVVYVDALGRYEANPDHPDYLARIKDWNTVYARKMSDALILLGTKINFIPPEIPGPEDNEWIQEHYSGFVHPLKYRLCSYKNPQCRTCSKPFNNMIIIFESTIRFYFMD